MENNLTIKEEIAKIKHILPDIKKITVDYNGAGDSFSDFYGLTFEPEQKLELNLEFLEDLLWVAIEASEADFNNDGSQGVITIDFEEETITVENEWNEMISHANDPVVLS